MSNDVVERASAPSPDHELHELLLGVQRGDVCHPDLKRWLIHLGFAEFRGLELFLTHKGQRLVQA